MTEVKNDMNNTNEVSVKSLIISKEYVMKQMVNNPLGSDITINCKNNEKIFAHKIILNPRNEFFNKLEENSIDFEFQKESVLIVLEYIYTFELDYKNINHNNLIEVLDICQKINCQIKLDKIFKKVISTKNVFEIYQKYDLKNIQEFCEKFIIKNYAIFRNTDEFNNLPKDSIISIQKKFIEIYLDENDLSDENSSDNESDESESE
jgi:hypothetical protein